jgi:hypothetical protein
MALQYKLVCCLRLAAVLFVNWLTGFVSMTVLIYCNVFHENWRLRHAPITCTMACKEVKVGEGQGETEHTVVPNVASWNVGFLWVRIFLLLGSVSGKTIFHLSFSPREYFILIREFICANPSRLSSPSEFKVTAPRKEQVRTCNNAVRLLNRLSYWCLSADLLCADWSLRKSRSWRNRQFNEKHYKGLHDWRFEWLNARLSST